MNTLFSTNSERTPRTDASQTDTPQANAAPSQAPDEAIHPLFPGRTFISTVLNVVDSKDTMTGSMTGKYLQRAMMAGLFIGIFFTAFFIIMGQFAQNPDDHPVVSAGKLLAATTFGWALVLIYYTNSELLTSNMMVVTIGAYHRRIGWLHSLRMLGLCLLGNLAGALVIAILMRCSTIISGPTLAQMLSAASTKTGYVTAGLPGIADLFVRGILCNFCINIAMLMVYNGKLNNDFTKCIIMVVAVFVFAYSGFEHSIADSALFLILALFGKVNIALAAATVAIAMLGNYVGGGILIGLNFATMNDERHLQPAD